MQLNWPVRQAWMKNIFGFPRRVAQWRSSKYSTMSRMRTGLASLVYSTPSLPWVRKQQTNASKLEWSIPDEPISKISRSSIVKSLWTCTSNFRSSNSSFSISAKSQIHTEHVSAATNISDRRIPYVARKVCRDQLDTLHHSTVMAFWNQILRWQPLSCWVLLYVVMCTKSVAAWCLTTIQVHQIRF